MSVWNISANYVFVPLKFNLKWNIWKPFLKSSPLDFSGQRLGNTSLAVFLRFHSFSQGINRPKFVRSNTTNILHVQCQISLTDRSPFCLREILGSLPTGTSVLQYCFTFQCAFYQVEPIILEETLTQNYQCDDFWLSLAHGADRFRVLRLENRMWELLCYVVLNTFDISLTTMYLMFDGFSTPVISFWLICTTRRWDRGSVWGHTLFLSELINF